MKSKFKTFILSMFPGGGHFYIGDTNRGLIFFVTLVALGFCQSFIRGDYNIFGGMHSFINAMIPLIWVYQVVDAQLSLSNIKKGKIDLINEGEERVRNNELIAIILSIIPGLGHFYLGRRKKGEQLFVIFLIAYFAGAIVSIDIVQLALPVVIIYSILDIKNQAGNFNIGLFKDNEGSESLVKYETVGFERVGKILGVIFIVAGIFLLADKLAPEFLDYQIINTIKKYVGIIISSVVIIGIGIKLLFSAGSNKN